MLVCYLGLLGDDDSGGVGDEVQVLGHPGESSGQTCFTTWNLKKIEKTYFLKGLTQLCSQLL